MNDNVFEQILRLLHEFCIEADMPSTVVTATPFCLHPLEEIASDLHFELRLPFLMRSGTTRAEGICAKSCMTSARFSASLLGRTVRVMRLWSSETDGLASQ